MNTSSIVATALAAVLIVALLMGAIVYHSNQGTVRRHDCVTSGGTWTSNNQCLRLVTK